MTGLWIAHFTAGAAHGNGLAVLRDGEILGGDLAHTWVGTFEEEGAKVYARVRIAPYEPEPNGEPTATDHPRMMTLSGSCGEREAVLNGRADDSDVAVTIQMHKAA